MQRNAVMGRIHVYLLALYFGFLSFQPTSNLGRLLDKAGVFGDAVGGLLLICGAVGVLDSLVNDVMTDRYALVLGLKYRHYLLMTVAGAYGTTMYMTLGLPDSFWFQPLFAIQIIMVAMVAFFDVRRRHKK